LDFLSGAFAEIYENPAMPQWVLKVFPGDRGYMNLYMLAKKTNNVHFPHVGRMGRLLIPGKPPVEDASVLAVMIERLAKWTPA